MTQRKAPRGGYSFTEKAHYREQIWRRLQQSFAGDTACRNVLLMPSIEGTEIEVALAHGFNESHLYVVDANPAIVATLKRRFKSIHTYGKLASIACARIAKEGVRLDAANFDFTACVGSKLQAEVMAIAAADCFAPRAYVAMTVLRGREQREFTAGLHAPVGEDILTRIEHVTYGEREVHTQDIGRLILAFGPLISTPNRLLHIEPRKVGIYFSPAAKQTMLWAVCRILDLNGIAGRVRKMTRSERLLFERLKPSLCQNSRNFEALVEAFKTKARERVA